MQKKLLFAGETGLSVQANAGLALLRIFAGISLMFAHGLGKLPPSPKFVESTAAMGFPLPLVFSWAAGLSETVGGLLLAIGLFTRFASFFIMCTMLTALIGVHFNDPFKQMELAMLYFFIAFTFFLKGSGDWSVDGIARR